jgi:hypothetical protein
MFSRSYVTSHVTAHPDFIDGDGPETPDDKHPGISPNVDGAVLSLTAMVPLFVEFTPDRQLAIVARMDSVSVTTTRTKTSAELWDTTDDHAAAYGHRDAEPRRTRPRPFVAAVYTAAYTRGLGLRELLWGPRT